MVPTGIPFVAGPPWMRVVDETGVGHFRRGAKVVCFAPDRSVQPLTGTRNQPVHFMTIRRPPRLVCGSLLLDFVRGSHHSMGKRLYVGNLPYDADEASLRAAFGRDGMVVERVNIVVDRETLRPRGFAFVDMATDEQAKQAIAALDGTRFGPRQLRVTEAEDRRPPGSGGGPRGPGGAPRSYGAGQRPGFHRSDAPRPEAGRADQSRSEDGGADGGRMGAPRQDAPRFEGSRGDAPRREEPMRPRFGPDAKPKHERMLPPRKPAKRRLDGDGDEDSGGRRGSRRYDDDDDE